MDPFPTLVDLTEDPDAIGQGHLWILEALEGIPLQFALQPDGQLEFADEHRRYRTEDVPPAVRPAVQTVQREFRRDAFRDAVDDVSSVTFYGVATCQHRLDYDWDRLPAFVGYDVRSPEQGGLLAPDAAHTSFDRLGLTPAPTVEREVRADAFHPERYSFPKSEWAASAVAGIRLADKHGWRAHLPNPDRPAEPTASFEDTEAAVEGLLTDELLKSVGHEIEHARDRIARAHRAELARAGIDPAAKEFRSAVARAVQQR